MERKGTLLGGTYYYLTPEEVGVLNNDPVMATVVVMRGKTQSDGRVKVRVADTLVMQLDRTVDEMFREFMGKDHGVSTTQIVHTTGNFEVLEKVD